MTGTSFCCAQSFSAPRALSRSAKTIGPNEASARLANDPFAADTFNQRPIAVDRQVSGGFNTANLDHGSSPEVAGQYRTKAT
jgi:hypothetical protein